MSREYFFQLSSANKILAITINKDKREEENVGYNNRPRLVIRGYAARRFVVDKKDAKADQ